MRKSLLLLLGIPVLLLCLYGCREAAEQNKAAVTQADLQEQDSCMIPLDSLTTQSTLYMQLIDDSILAFFNHPTYQICMYDLKKHNTDKITINRTGPNAVVGVDAFCYVSPDSIWLFSSWGNRMTLIDNAGNVKAVRNVPVHGDKDGKLPEYAVFTYPRTTTPYIIKNGVHYICGAGSSNCAEGQLPGVTMLYNERDSTVITANPYPDVYGATADLANWSLFTYRHAQYTLSPDDNIVLSFPVSDSVYVYNPKDGSRRAFFGGYSKPTNIHCVVPDSREASAVDYIVQNQYDFIVYDKYNRLYYRLIKLAKKDYDANNLTIECARKPNAVIILNENFEKVGETMLPQDTYHVAHAFVNENGLHIKVESDDDDFMKFRVFKPRKD